MILHPVIPNILQRRDQLLDAVQKGHLAPEVSRYAQPGWAYVLKEKGTPALAYPSIGNFNAVDEDAGSIAYVVTTDIEDRDGDIVRPMGAHLQNYSQNPIVFFGHQEKPIPIGVCRSPDGRITVFPEENRMIDVIHFDREDPDADFIYHKCKRKILNATSIAFVPIEAWRRSDVRKAHGQSQQEQPGWYFNQWDKTEVSIVGVPSNPKAVGLAKDLMGACRDVFDRERSFMSPNLQKAWQSYVAQAKGCFAGWCPLPGEEKDLGGGVVLKAVKKAVPQDIDGSSSIPFGDRKVGEEFSIAIGGGKFIHGTKTGPDKFKKDDGNVISISHWTRTKQKSADPDPETVEKSVTIQQVREVLTRAGVSDFNLRDDGQSIRVGTHAADDPDGESQRAYSALRSAGLDARGGQGSVVNVFKSLAKSSEPDPEMDFAEQVRRVGEELAGSTDPAPMPGYGQVFRGPNNELWYVGGDGDEDGFADLVVEKLGSIEMVSDVTYEAEGFPPKDEGWEQLYPAEEKAVKKRTRRKKVVSKVIEASCSCDDCSAGKACQCGKSVTKAADEGAEVKAQPSADIDPEKACQILRDGTVNGVPITDDQRGMFGAACAKAQKSYGGLRETCKALVKKGETSTVPQVVADFYWKIFDQSGGNWREALRETKAKFDLLDIRVDVANRRIMTITKQATQADLDSPGVPGRNANPSGEAEQEKHVPKSLNRRKAYRAIQETSNGHPMTTEDYDLPGPAKPIYLVVNDQGHPVNANGQPDESSGREGFSYWTSQSAANAVAQKLSTKKSKALPRSSAYGVRPVYEGGKKTGKWEVYHHGRGPVAGPFNSREEAEAEALRLHQRKSKKALEQSDGRVGGYTVSPGDVQSDKKQEPLDDTQPPGWTTCESCHGDSNCNACGGIGEGCDECGGSGECPECAGQGHTEKSLVRKAQVIMWFPGVKGEQHGRVQGTTTEYELKPVANGLFDLYVDGKLVEPSNTMQEGKRRAAAIPAKSFRKQNSAGHTPAQIAPQNTDEEPMKQELDEEKPSLSTPQVLAALYSHAKAEAAYLDQLDDQYKDTLADYRRQQVEERMDMLKYQFSRAAGENDDLEKMCKAFEDEHDKGMETDGPDSVVEPGEAGMVEAGEIPPEEESEPLTEKQRRKRARTMKQNTVPAEGAYTEDDPEAAAELDSGSAPFNKAAPGTEEWEAEEAQEPEHKSHLGEKSAGGQGQKAQPTIMYSCLECDFETDDQREADNHKNETGHRRFSSWRKNMRIKSEPGTEEWAEEELEEPEHQKAGDPGDSVDEGPTVYNKEDDEAEEKQGGGICMCGMEIPEGATECPGCGAPVEKADLPLEEPPLEEEAPPVEMELDEDAVPKDSDPSTEEIIERYRQPKSNKWATRKHRVKKSLLPFLKHRVAANGKKYLVRAKQTETEEETKRRKESETLDDAEVKALTIKLAGAIDDLKSLVKAREVPKHLKPALKHIAETVWYVGKALTDKGKVQANGGGGSELTDAGKVQVNGGKGGELKDKGEQQGKSPTKNHKHVRQVSPAVQQKFEETLAKLKRFGVLNGSV